MSSALRRFAGISRCFLAGCIAATAQVGLAADALPASWRASNVEPVAYHQMEPGRAFKLSLKQSGDRWLLFVGYGDLGGTKGRRGFAIVDFTDAAKPRTVKFVEVPNASGQITLSGNLLIAGAQVPFGARGTISPFSGVAPAEVDLASFWDISDPLNPVRLSTWRGRGWGTHRNLYLGGQYAYMAAWIEGYRGQSVLVTLDVSDPKNPREVGRFWWPGQREDEVLQEQPTGYHGYPVFSQDGKMMTLAMSPGLINLDITNRAYPKVLGKLVFSPLMPAGTPSIHTVMPLHDGYVHINTEPGSPGCDDETLPFAAIIDNRNPAKPRLAAYYPRPEPPPGWTFDSFCKAGGRFGAHNVNGEVHLPGVQAPNHLIYMTYFIAGVRIFNVADPNFPKEVGWFLPVTGPWNQGFRGVEDILVDTRGNAFVSDGVAAGIWVLRYTGK